MSVAAAAAPSFEWQARLAGQCKPGSAPGCSIWTGGATIRFQRQRWQPRRLLYALQGPRYAEALRQAGDLVLTATCGTPGCVAPAHQTLTARQPPPQRTKRKFMEPADPALLERFRQAAQIRKRLLQLEATLARIDALEASLPPEMHNTEEAARLVQEAMRPPDAPPDTPLPPCTVVLDGPDAEARAERILADPYGYVLGHRVQ